MSKVLAREIIMRYMNNDNEGHKDNFKPGFNPQETAAPHCETTIETMIEKILNGPRDRTIDQMKELGKETMEEAFGKTISALS
jgi:hypothetical protein